MTVEGIVMEWDLATVEGLVTVGDLEKANRQTGQADRETGRQAGG